MKKFFFVGTYTDPILFGTGEVFTGKGKGIYLCSFDGTNIETITVIPAVNPSFVCVDEKKRKLYAVNETKEWQGAFGGGISQWRYDAAGSFILESTQGTGGTDPCHVAISPDERWLAIANFASGSLTAFPLDEHGCMTSERKLFQHQGSSVNQARQTGPHAHSAIFGPDNLLYVPDLGIDKVVSYRCAGEISPLENGDLSAAPGSGPRYGEFSADGNHFYLINEIASTVAHYVRSENGMVCRDTVSTLPECFTEKSIGADLHLTPNGQYLYASNRGHDSIAIYRVEKDGALTVLGHQPCGGRTPRNFAIDPEGEYLFVGNQDTDNVTVFTIQGDGMLQPVGDYAFPTPVCIRFLTQWC